MPCTANFLQASPANHPTHASHCTAQAGVRRYFPTLPALLHLDRDFPLPPHLDHFQSKTYWDVIIAGVRGTVQLYANSPDRASALEGARRSQGLRGGLLGGGLLLSGCCVRVCTALHLQRHSGTLSSRPAPRRSHAGSACYPFELSMRVAREDAGDRLGEVLKLVGSAGDVLGDNGWDATRAGFSAA